MIKPNSCVRSGIARQAHVSHMGDERLMQNMDNIVKNKMEINKPIILPDFY